MLYSDPCVFFREKLNFNTAISIPFINKDKNKISETIQIAFYMQDSETVKQTENAVFVGETYLPWKQTLERNGEWVQ